MSKRPLCQVLVLLILLIGLLEYFGGFWLWKSPLGTLPFEWAANEQSADVTGVVYEQEEKTYQNQTYTYLYLKQTYLSIESKNYPIRRIKCTIKGEQIDCLGCQVFLSGVLCLPEKSGNPGEFDQRLWEESRKIDFYLTEVFELKILNQATGISNITNQIKERGREILLQIFPEEEAAVLEAMILGDKSSLETETKNQFQAAGISHIIAISGLHMSLIGMGIWNVCKWIGIPMAVASIGSVGVLMGYGILLGNPTTAFRALLMFGVLMGAKILGRSYDMLSALSAAGIVLLLDNPDILGNSGFQLSFMAVLGMGCYCNLEEKIFQGIWEPKRKLGTSLRSGLALWFFSLPVVLFSFYQVSVLGILINLLVIPLMPVVLGSGLLALFAGIWGAGLGSIVGIPAFLLLKGYEWMGALAERCPFGMWTPGKPGIWHIILYYILLFCTAYGLQYVSKIKNGNQKRKRKTWIATELITKILLIMLMSTPWDSAEKMTVLDVGQGDGIVLQSDGQSILVDGGSSSQKQVGKYVLLPYFKYEGISELDLILITHSDEDHMNGVLEILEESQKGWFHVRAVAMPYWMKQTNEGANIENLARLVRTEVIYLKKADQIDFGNTKIDILYPEEEDFSEDTNAGSLVFEWETECGTGLFTGDLPSQQEEVLLTRVKPCFFLKVGHHGSNDSTTTAFLDTIQPRFAFISCGENNRYGHPGEELLQRLYQSGCEIYRTDLQGAVTIDIVHGKVEIWGKT